MIITTIIICILSAYAFTLVLRHNMHMFQLNGYKNDEHIHWLIKNKRQQWLLYFTFILGIIRFFAPVLALDILIILTLIMIMLVYRALRRLNNKKKLVYTPRVKRMITTIIIVCIISVAVELKIAGYKMLGSIAIILVALQIISNLLANVINHPIEVSINNYYEISKITIYLICFAFIY